MSVSKINLYFKEKSQIYKKINSKIILKVFKAIKKTYDNDGIVFLMANGGSSSIAEGFAVDLRTHPFVNDDKSITTSKRRIKVECLTESSGCLTGISNDIGFDFIFQEQLKNYMRSKTKNKNDLLIAFSGSGNSPNIINAITFAKKFGVKSFCVSGRGGGKASKIVDYALIIPGSSKFPGQTGKNDNNFHIEDIQNSTSHVLVGLLKEYVQKK
jgi:D-sedoheptulose 7-phosphate isomerase|tara:strand:- start:105 stop:743 length:639 start_codon:yes stop_codon:yes gene_type:complete